jgi:hypothetical protein
VEYLYLVTNLSRAEKCQTFNEDKHPLSLTAGIEMIGEAIVKVKQRGGNTIFFEEILDNLKHL